MRFIRDDKDITKINDQVFKISKLAQEDKDSHTINATIGSLYDDNNQIVALESFFDNFNQIDSHIKAKYAESFLGNKEYKEAIIKHVLLNKIHLNYDALATSGGTGAISLIFKDILEESSYILLPNIAWGSYELMAMEYNLKIINYDIYDLNDLIKKVKELSKRQNKILLVINSPLNNPTGLSYSKDDWKYLIDYFNTLDNQVIILNDIAYIDYSFNLDESHDYLEIFNSIDDNILVAIAYSLSKSMTAYGLRCGALILVHKSKEVIETCMNALAKSCRALWSNVNNGAMIAFSNTINNDYDNFINEKNKYIAILKNRANIFIAEANKYHLAFYDYKEGFFITLKVANNQLRDKYHKALIDNHIYTIKTNLGIRIAICSIPTNKIANLAYRIKDIIDNI